MKVEILNPEALQNLYKNHGEFACVCYNTPSEKAEQVGKNCQQSGHLSGSRCEYIKFKISDVDRGTAEQIMRHEIGTSIPIEYQDNYSFADFAEAVKDVSPDQIVKNMASFRYIDKTGFSWVTPWAIRSVSKAKQRYDALMDHINAERIAIKEMLESSGIKPGIANEAVNFTLPRATKSELVVGFTPEAFVHFCHKRLCSRAQEYIRQFAKLAKDECARYCPEYAAELKPHCEHLLWCPEGSHCCGHLPTKKKLMELLQYGAEVAA